MEGEVQSAEEVSTTRGAQVAEATFITQREDHTLPAKQVFVEQRESAARGLASVVYVP